jgi:hypothetical protein
MRIVRAACPVVLASPIDVVGWTPPTWGNPQYYRVRLTFFQDPASSDHYCATLQGTPELFAEFVDIMETRGKSELTRVIRVC